MPGLVIKDLPPELHRELKERAARHHRSMTKEVLAMLEWAVREEPPPQEPPPPFEGHFALTDKFVDRAKREGRA